MDRHGSTGSLAGRLATLRSGHGLRRANSLVLWQPLALAVRVLRQPGHFFPWLAAGLARGVLWFHAWYLGLIILLCSLFTFLNPAVTGIMIYRAFDSRHKVSPTVFIPMVSIPKYLRRAFISLEDHFFYSHGGIHLGAIREALERNLARGELIFGGSTISQQAARTLFLNPDRTMVRKWLELLAVFPMEWILGKDRILELYLNYIEFGKGAFGLGRGALYQYGKRFSTLSADERLRMAVIITSPLRWTVNNFYKQPGMAARYRALQ